MLDRQSGEPRPGGPLRRSRTVGVRPLNASNCTQLDSNKIRMKSEEPIKEAIRNSEPKEELALQIPTKFPSLFIPVKKL